MFGGTVKLEQAGVPNFTAHLQSAVTFGIAGGVRFDSEDCEGCGLIEFRWLRQSTHLTLDRDPLVAVPLGAAIFNPGVHVDRFLGDFTREFPLPEAHKVHPFLTASLGAARLGTPETSATRFAFGLATGVKVFPKRHWGFRIQLEYLPIVMHAEVQRVVCTVGCVVLLNGGVMNQFDVTVGPAFRF
jgi:hypothetical protein